MTENHKTIHLLVVSRDAAVLRALDPLEKSPAWRLETAANGWEAMERMQSGTAAHALVLDIALEDSEPIHFLRWLRCFRPDFPAILLCAPEDAVRVKDAAGLDGEDMVHKPFDARSLETVIRKRMEAPGNLAENFGRNAGKNHIEPLGPDACFVSASLIMQKLRAQAALLAKTDVPVLIVGERGAGKYTVASLIHKLSVRSGFKLLRVDCAALPEAELEAELFGGETGSASSRAAPGRFAAGEKGTIFLEEITEMPAGVQARLLQVLQNVLPNDLHDPEPRTAGGAEGMPARVRILASSSANLERALEEKQLREDLYHRLSAFTLQVPPLRQRKEEIPTLLRYFMHHLSRHYGLPARGFSPGLVAACQRYCWPGNLSELEALVKRYLVAGEPESIFGQKNGGQKNGGEQNSGEKYGESSCDGGEAADTTANGGWEPVSTWRAVMTGAALPEDNGGEPAEPGPESLKSLIHGVKCQAERNAIAAALLRTGWNRKAAARMLKVSYRTMLYKIEQYKMRAPQPHLSPLPAAGFSRYESGYEERVGGAEARYADARYAKVR